MCQLGNDLEAPVTDTFDKHYWERHWEAAGDRAHDRGLLPNPYIARELGDLAPGSALDAGCGEGVEAIWLAVNGWDVTAVDISSAALDRARQRARDGKRARGIDWVEADLSVWEPGRTFELVMTNYAHPAISQLAFYERIAKWVAPGGTLLIVGHLDVRDHGGEHGGDHIGDPIDGHGVDGHRPPREASVTADAITELLDSAPWEVVSASEASRTRRDGAGHSVELHDVVVRARRRV